MCAGSNLESGIFHGIKENAGIELNAAIADNWKNSVNLLIHRCNYASAGEQRSTTLKKRINVVGAVLTRGQTILAAQRSPSMSLPGMWEFPGGKIEPGELPKQALVRELDEELLCSAEIGEHIQTTEHEYDFGIVILTTYYCSLTGDEPRLTEHSEIRWVPVAELDQLNWAPADIPAVEQVMKDFQV